MACRIVPSPTCLWALTLPQLRHIQFFILLGWHYLWSYLTSWGKTWPPATRESPVYTWLLQVLCKHHAFSSLSALAQDVPCLEWPRPSVGSLKSYPCFYPAQWWPAMWHLLAFFVFVFILLSRIFSNMQVSGQSCVVTFCVPISQLQQWPDFF